MRTIEGLPPSVQKLAMIFVEREQDLLTRHPTGCVGAPQIFVSLDLLKTLAEECVVNDDGTPYQSKVHLSPNSPYYRGEHG